MPTYEYRCAKCGKRFSKTMSVKELESVKVKCPKCSSARVVREISGFFANTSRKS
ncbi:MAG: zinc ribbon domain-containing protein [Verrucomicrobia bacterium]|nr:zinc ribbon domain-containing protein [Verrucomicrobiota bacterium]